MLVANLGAGPFALLIPLADTGPCLTLIVLGGVEVGAAAVVGNVLKGSFRQSYTPRHLLGRVIVGMQFLNYGTIPLGALLGGALSAPLVPAHHHVHHDVGRGPHIHRPARRPPQE